MSWFRSEKRSEGARFLPDHNSLESFQRGRVPDPRALVLLVVILLIGVAYLFRDSGWGFDANSDAPYEGIRYEAIGDSITFGLKFNFTVDNLNHPAITNAVYQGWPELLGDMLSERTGVVTSVINEGHPGDRLIRVLDERIPVMFRKRRHADAALLLIGTNDSSAFESTPSGAGCSGANCTGTLKGRLLRVIAKLHDHGRETVHVALIPPAWGPDPSSLFSDPLSSEAERNHRIIQYNQVIAREIATQPGVALGPDFFSCFLSSDNNRFSLFYDHLHPNALGNLVMATLWRDAVTGNRLDSIADGCPSPVYILESLDPYRHGQKQNLLAEGDPYYLDESFTLINIPDELVNGIWVLQANADRDNRDEEFLSFDAGNRPVTVYVAYDPAGVPPVSPSHSFLPFTLSAGLAVSDPSVKSFSVVRAVDVTGTVSIGGNKSGASKEPQQGFVVIVVP